MTTFTTLWQKTTKHRKTGKVEVVHGAYQTKSLTEVHARLRKHWQGKTYEGGRLFTDFVPGFKLDKPFVSGGKLLDL